MAKIRWNATMNEGAPGQPQVSGDLHDVDFMAKDSKRFADSGGWGYAAFMYEKASDDWRPFTTDDNPSQEHDAKCGFSCHVGATGFSSLRGGYAISHAGDDRNGHG